MLSAARRDFPPAGGIAVASPPPEPPRTPPVLMANSKTKAPTPSCREIGDALPHVLVAEVRDYGIIIADQRNRVQMWSPGAGHVSGFREREMLGKCASVIFTPTTSPPPRARRRSPSPFASHALARTAPAPRTSNFSLAVH